MRVRNESAAGRPPGIHPEVAGRAEESGFAKLDERHLLPVSTLGNDGGETGRKHVHTGLEDPVRTLEITGIEWVSTVWFRGGRILLSSLRVIELTSCPSTSPARWR